VLLRTRTGMTPRKTCEAGEGYPEGVIRASRSVAHHAFG
jgi:hypothetical protein